MTKKILIGLFILLLIAVSIIAFNFYKNVKQPVNDSSIIAVPQNAALILQENNFSALYNKISSTNIMWEELVNGTESGQNINSQIHYIDSLFNHPFKNITLNQSILSSVHLSGANHFDFIFYLNFSKKIKEDILIKKIKSAININISKRIYDNVNIYTLTTKKNEKIAFTYYKNIFAFSYSTVLIEDVIRQLNTENSLLDNIEFKKIFDTSGQSEDGNLYINNSNFSKLTEQFLNSSSKKYFKNFEHYANWSELDITTKPNALIMNGFTLSNDSSNQFLSLFKEQKPQQINILSITPSNTAMLYYYGLSNSKTFFEKRKTLLKSQNQFFSYQNFLNQQLKDFEIDIEEEFLHNIGNELAIIITEPLTEDYTKNQYIVFRSDDIEKTTKNLTDIAQKINNTPHLINTFNEHPIYQVNLKNVFTPLLGKPFVNIDNPYYTFIDNYIIFSHSESAIKTFIQDVNNDKTLNNNKDFESYNENLSEDANLFIYLNIARSTNLLKVLSNEDHSNIFKEKLELFRKFEAISFQVNTQKNNLYYNNIYLKYNPVYKQDTRSLWELKIDTTISSQPQIVTNHKTSAKEIFIQDDANKIYLISNTGKIIWTKQLQEKIIGKTHQIDVYKNKKLQLLFNTKSKIYLIDRNGNNVERFPVKLKHKATNGITPLDYEKNRNYRLLIGCNDNMVYNYNVQGGLVDGWKYQSSDSYANSKIWHTVFSGKDYIIIPLQNGSIKVIERSGKDRLILKNHLPITSNPIYLKITHDISKTYLTTIDSSGLIVNLYLNDKTESIKINEATPNSNYSFYNFKSTNSFNYIFTKENKLTIFSDEKENLFEIELDHPIDKFPLFFKAPDQSNKIGLVSNNNIYLINSEGNIEEDFPLTGSTLFSIIDINNDKTMNLVVGDNNKIYTYNLK